MYYPILRIIMAVAGIYFTVLTKGVQIRMFPESIRLLMEPPEDKAVEIKKLMTFQPSEY